MSDLHGYELSGDNVEIERATVDVFKGVNVKAAQDFLTKRVKLSRITYVKQDSPNADFYIGIETSPVNGCFQVLDVDNERIALLSPDDCDLDTPYVFKATIYRYGLMSVRFAGINEYTETKLTFNAALNINARAVYLFKQSKNRKTGASTLSLAITEKAQSMGISIPALHTFMGGRLIAHINALSNNNGRFDARQDDRAKFYNAFIAQRESAKAIVSIADDSSATPELPAIAPSNDETVID